MEDIMHATELEAAVKKVSASISPSEGLKPNEYSDEDLYFLYNLGYKLYAADDYLKSEEIFRRLVVAKPFEVRHWQALASTLQMQKRYQDALLSWSMCCLINTEEATYHLYAGECLASLGETKEAKKALTCAEKLVGDDSPIKGKIEAYKEAWEVTDE